MAAKSKKRLSKIENKLFKLDKLELTDVICSICQSILIEPVTLPCYHDFCKACFNGSVENNALCCPLCRLRIGSWLRSTTKQNNLVNTELWTFLKTKFAEEINSKLKGEDIIIPEEKPALKLSAPGEIKSEYEAELNRLRAEREQLENKHFKETELLIRKLQEEEEEAHRKYVERLKQDEILALSLQASSAAKTSVSPVPNTPKQLPRSQNVSNSITKPKLKASTIDKFLCKKPQFRIVKDSPLLTDDNTSTDSSTPKASTSKGGSTMSSVSPEMVPTYSKIKNFLDKKMSSVSGLWRSGGNNSVGTSSETPKSTNVPNKKPNKPIHSLPISLPYTGTLKHKRIQESKNTDNGSTDSMRMELCYFKPIEAITPTSFKWGKGLPLRIPTIKVNNDDNTSPPKLNETPSRSQYLDGLCQLRNMSLAQKLPSAFVIALSLLRVKKETHTKEEIKTKTSPKKSNATPIAKKITKNRNHVNGVTKIKPTFRRTRSMGSLRGELTPKKDNVKRQVHSERKPYLRSDSKRSNTKNSPPADVTNNNKVKLVMKNLSSQLESCQVKKILEEQLRIERMIAQEKSDLELAMQVDAEVNGGRRRNTLKRQVTLNYGLRPAKKLRVQ